MFGKLISWVTFASLVLSAFAPDPRVTRAVASDAPSVVEPPTQSSDYGKLPLVFEKNQGQTDSTVQFLGRANGYTLFLTREGATFKLRQDGDKSATLKMRLSGSNSNPRLGGIEKLPGKTNYYTGRNPKDWREGVPNYAKVPYESVYDGIDMIYYMAGKMWRLMPLATLTLRETLTQPICP